MTLTLTLTLRMTAAVRTVQSVRPGEAPSGLTTPNSVGSLLGTKEVRGM